jgi:hypothetical protein
MLKKLFMKQALKSQLKDVPAAEQEMILDMVEKNPAFFENLAKELQEGIASGRDQQTVALEIMGKHQTELRKLLGRQ